MSSNRLEKIRKSRSVNDLIDIINEIAKEVRSGKKAVEKLTISISAKNEDEIKIDHSGKKSPEKMKITQKTPSEDTLGVKLTKFVVPPKDVLVKHNSTIQSMYENASELDAAEALLQQTFAGVKNQPAALRALRALKEEVDSSLNRAFSALNKLANKHLPTEMEQLSDSLISYLIDHLDKKSYDNMTKMVYVAPDESNNILFSIYIGIEGLKNGSGFVFDEFYVILTGLVDKKGYIRYFLNTLPDFKVPGKYPVGKEITTEKDMIQRFKFLLAHNDLVSDFERKPMPLTTDQAKTKGLTNIPNVSDAYVEDDALYVVIKKGKDSDRVIKSVVLSVMPLLNLLVGNARRSKSVIKYKPLARKGTTVLQFILTPQLATGDDQDLSLNLQKLKELKSLLDLSDKEVEAIKHALKNI